MTVRTLLLAALFAGAATPVLAHHGWGGNEEKLTDGTGRGLLAASLVFRRHLRPSGGLLVGCITRP